MSTLRTDTIENVAGTKTIPTSSVIDGVAKAWVNFNGSGTVAIRAAFNVSSITDGGVGTYTVNFATAMADANYAPVVSMVYAATNNISQIGSLTVNGFYVGSILATTGAAGSDPTTVSVAVFR